VYALRELDSTGIVHFEPMKRLGLPLLLTDSAYVPLSNKALEETSWDKKDQIISLNSSDILRNVFAPS